MKGLISALCGGIFIALYLILGTADADIEIVNDYTDYTTCKYDHIAKPIKPVECKSNESKPVESVKPVKIKHAKPVEATPMKAEELIEWKLTAYCPCRECSGGYGRHTATGKIARSGRTIAVDPKVIPYGTKVMIDGHEYVAEDCGGAVKGYHIDIFFDTHDEVEKFGKKYGFVYVKRKKR